MKHIFYFIGILFVIHELFWILNPKAQTEKAKKLNQLSKLFKDKKWDEYSQEYKDIIIFKGIPYAIFLTWLFLGILTFNWVAFAFIILFNLVIIAPISKLFKFSAAYTVLHWLNSIIGIAFGVFVIVNSYHLKINLFEVIKNLF